MQYQANYDIVGAEDAGHGTVNFDAADDRIAQRIAAVIVGSLEEIVNEQIKNPFWHWQYTLKTVFKVEGKKVSEIAAA